MKKERVKNYNPSIDHPGRIRYIKFRPHWSIYHKKEEGCLITETFLNLDPTKQRRIIDAALKEFAEQGYEQASTNRIVKDAGIGKGMLFYYFNSKKDLYSFLIEHSIHFIMDKYLNHIEDEPDFIERYRKIVKLKMKVIAEAPHVFHFIGTIMLEDEKAIPEQSKNEIKQLKELGFKKLFGNVDSTLFRDDIAPAKILKFIQWSMDGYEKEILNRLKGQKIADIDLDPYWDEFYEYLDVLRRIFYK